MGIGCGAVYSAHSREGPLPGSANSILCALPLNAIGVTAHYAASVPVPRALRRPLYRSYCAWLGCDPEETDGDLTDFTSLAAFFGRRLRPDSRQIDNEAALTVPCDGVVIDAGPVGAYGAIQVKNMSYQLRDLLGAGEREPLAESSVAVADRKESGARLWYTVIHILPGQCHRFSSPTSWSVSERRHMQGHLLWLNPGASGLYTSNERIALTGSWDHGFFSMTAVGAAGRGSIELSTSQEAFRPQIRPNSSSLSRVRYPEAKRLSPGHEVGGFKLGSAIVLVFEAPDTSFVFHVHPGDHVKLGQKLATVGVSRVQKHIHTPRSEAQDAHTRYSGIRARFQRAW